MLSGQVKLLVEQFDRVEAGQELLQIDSPAWRDVQQRIAEAASAISRLTTKLETFGPLQAAHERHEETLVSSTELWIARVEQLDSLRKAGGGRINELAGARASLGTARAELAEVQERKAELAASRAETRADLEAARSRLSFLFDSTATLLGLERDSLVELIETDEGPRPFWATIGVIRVHAVCEGVVESLGLTNGAWADEKVAAVTVVQPERVRFRASGLQSDLGVLRPGLHARIVPPTPTTGGRAVNLQDTMEGVVGIGLSNDPADRTVDLYVTPKNLSGWALPGVSAQLEIVTDGTTTAELAIPLAAVQRDGIRPVIFRRAPDNPDEAIRLEADLGMNDGRWVTVLSGLRDGDEVVLDGAFQLMLATSGSMQKGGHFHADGTFHEGEH